MNKQSKQSKQTTLDETVRLKEVIFFHIHVILFEVHNQNKDVLLKLPRFAHCKKTRKQEHGRDVDVTMCCSNLDVQGGVSFILTDLASY